MQSKAMQSKRHTKKQLPIKQQEPKLGKTSGSQQSKTLWTTNNA